MAKSNSSDAKSDGLKRDNPISRSSGPATTEPGPPRKIGKVEEQGVPATDTQARSPLGVGRSEGRRGESFTKRKGTEPGRGPTGTTGKSERPAGKSTGRDRTSVKPPTRERDE